MAVEVQVFVPFPWVETPRNSFPLAACGTGIPFIGDEVSRRREHAIAHSSRCLSQSKVYFHPGAAGAEKIRNAGAIGVMPAGIKLQNAAADIQTGGASGRAYEPSNSDSQHPPAVAKVTQCLNADFILKACMSSGKAWTRFFEGICRTQRPSGFGG